VRTVTVTGSLGVVGKKNTDRKRKTAKRSLKAILAPETTPRPKEKSDVTQNQRSPQKKLGRSGDEPHSWGGRRRQFSIRKMCETRKLCEELFVLKKMKNEGKRGTALGERDNNRWKKKKIGNYRENTTDSLFKL